MLLAFDPSSRTLLVDMLSDVCPPLTSQVPAARYEPGWKAVLAHAAGVNAGRVFEVARLVTGALEWRELVGFSGHAFGVWQRLFHDPQYLEAEAEASTTLDTFQTRATLAFTVGEAGTWNISVSAEHAMANANRDIELQCLLDGSTIALVRDRSSAGDRFQAFATFRQVALATGAHALLVQYRSITSGQTAKIRRVRCAASRVL